MSSLRAPRTALSAELLDNLLGVELLGALFNQLRYGLGCELLEELLGAIFGALSWHKPLGNLLGELFGTLFYVLTGELGRRLFGELLGELCGAPLLARIPRRAP